MYAALMGRRDCAGIRRRGETNPHVINNRVLCQQPAAGREANDASIVEMSRA